MSTHIICFRREIRKLFTWYPLLSRPMNWGSGGCRFDCVHGWEKLLNGEVYGSFLFVGIQEYCHIVEFYWARYQHNLQNAICKQSVQPCIIVRAISVSLILVCTVYMCHFVRNIGVRNLWTQVCIAQQWHLTWLYCPTLTVKSGIFTQHEQ